MNHFDRNISVLRRMHPEFAFLNELETEKGKNIDLLPASSGEITEKIDGFFLHSRLDPRREARRFLENTTNTGCAVFFGFGLGYYVEEYLLRYPSGNAVVVEPDPGQLKAAFEARDLSAVLGSPGFSLILAAEPDALAMVLNTIHAAAVSIVAPRSLVRPHEEYYTKLRAVVDSFTARREINLNTLNRFGKRWVRNLTANITHLPGAQRLHSLKGACENLPALLLAAGPSLDTVLEYLPALAERFILFAVDTSLRAVLRTGVTPDFLVIVDPQYWNARHLDGCRTENSILITESATYPSVFRRSYRAVFFGASLFPLGSVLERDLGQFGKLGAGGSVATSAWDAARQMGCTPIFAAGLDLGFPKLGTHFKGGRFEELVLSAAGRRSPVETGNFSSVNSAAPFEVASNSGRGVLTDKRLIIYKWWFENQLKIYPNLRCGNLSYDGVRIEGMRFTPVGELLDYPILSDRPPGFQGAAEEVDNITVEQRREVLRSSVAGLIGNLKSLRLLAMQACELTRNLDVSGSLEPLNQIDRMLLTHEAKDVAGFLLQDVAFDILKESRTNATFEDIKKQSLYMYEKLRDSAEYHIGLLSAREQAI